MGLQPNTETNLVNITCHNEGFTMPADWPFFATSQRKSACDGVGGSLKEPTAKANLQQPYNDKIMTLHQLYKWAQSSIHNLNCDSVTENEYKQD
jgi:hypothetical protein